MLIHICVCLHLYLQGSIIQYSYLTLNVYSAGKYKERVKRPTLYISFMANYLA
jgi:hypothetical protein